MTTGPEQHGHWTVTYHRDLRRKEGSVAECVCVCGYRETRSVHDVPGIGIACWRCRPIVRGANGRVRALDVPYAKDQVAQELVAEGPQTPEAIAEAYGATKQAIYLILDQALASFGKQWRRLYGTECPVAPDPEGQGGRNTSWEAV